MSKKISDQVVEILKTAGVRKIYGIPGDTIDTLMESIRADNEVDFVLTRHEANAGFMASGEARISNKIGVAVACQGPGANNLLNGLADAARDGIPVLAITGQIDTEFIDTNMPQGSNQIQLFEDITLFNAEARSPRNLIEILYIAINAALKGGVAHISIPSDIMRAGSIKYKKRPFVYRKNSTLLADEQSIERAVEAIDAKQKIAILYGEGSRGQAKQLIELAEKLKAPLIHTTRSKDIIDNTHPQVLGGIGLMGSHPANEALQECELLLIVGSNYAYKRFYPSVPVVKIDNNPLHLATHVSVDYPLLSDVSYALTQILQKVEAKKDKTSFFDTLKNSLAKHLDDFVFLDYKTADDKPIHPSAVVAEVVQNMQDDAILCGDSGSATIWINNVARFQQNQRFIWSANLATLGAALGQAMGAWFSSKREVIVIAGDGGFSFSISDLVTAAMYGVPVKCFILNNSRFRFIEFEERSHDGNVPYGTKLLNPDFAAIAEASHCKGISVHNYKQLQAAVKEAFAYAGPVVVDCRIDPDALLIPPAVNAEMAYNYIKSEIKSWFTTSDKIEQKIVELSQNTSS